MGARGAGCGRGAVARWCKSLAMASRNPLCPRHRSPLLMASKLHVMCALGHEGKALAPPYAALLKRCAEVRAAAAATAAAAAAATGAAVAK